MVLITPGIDFIARSFAVLGVAVATAAGVGSLLASRGIVLSTWSLALGVVLGLPLLAALRIIKTEISHRRHAAALGSRMVPRAQGAMIGNIDILKSMMENWRSGYPGDGLFDLVEARGPVVNIRVLWSDLLFTASPEHIKTILATDFNNYVKGERFHHTMASVLGTGVFNSDGDMWKFHRSITRPIFTRDRISHFELFDKHADVVIGHIKNRMRSGDAIDFQDLMARFTLDSATEFMFGSCVHSLSANIPYPHNASYIPPQTMSARSAAANDFSRAFLDAQEIIAGRERRGWVWPLGEIFKDATTEPMKVVNSYIDPIIRDAIQKKQHSPPKEKSVESEIGEDETLLDHLIEITSDPRVLKDEVLNIMIAGRDTTAATLTFIFYFLSLYPDITVRLREEILAKVGPTRRPDYDDIRDMKYLRAVINETLRLYPIVPFNVRESVHAATWPSSDPMEKPYYIPAGTKTAYSVFMMHRRKDLWGPDAEEFDPDRFLDDRLKKYLVKNSFIFLPFNAGPRICLGQQFAYNEMSFMIIRLLQNFSSVKMDLDATPVDAFPPKAWAGASGRKGIEKVYPRMHLTMYAHGGLWLKMQETESGN
ncbi:cytochrome P450 monooxygenase pc-3 [Crucibulum laeve]|uniref:Cytochrome P450 monooxygenase pc-3 n=1 Tax=Crucibulum laeve TaxID=68775 RepID=A0A5C3LX47_9AGAR|nr:cytochrome P450 monooxygenase pc-3 [Crucibulum laeve]